jgi:hypothetical protein
MTDPDEKTEEKTKDEGGDDADCLGVHAVAGTYWDGGEADVLWNSGGGQKGRRGRRG